MQAGNKLTSKMLLRKEEVTIFIILIIAFIARLAGINTRPIWYDEALAILFSEKGLHAMLLGTLTPDATGAAANVHPLAYHTLLNWWMTVFGVNIISARMLSIIFGTCTVAMSYYLMKSIFSDGKLATIGGLGVALSPFLVHYGQEIRMYSLLALALTSATYFYWRGLWSDKWRWWVFFSIFAALAMYTQNLAVFYLVPLALTAVLIHRWDKVKMTFLAGMGAIILYLPWMVNLPAQIAKVQNAYWVKQPTVSKIFTTILVFVTNLPVLEGWLPLALVISILVIILSSYQTYLAFRRNLPASRRGFWLAYLAFAPPALAFLFSQWQPIFLERAFIASGVMFWLWLAWALTATRLPRFLKVTTLTLLAAGIALGLVSHITYRGFPYGPFAKINESLKSRIEPGDVIIHSNKLTYTPAFYFDPELEQHFLSDPPGSGSDTLAPPTQQVLGIAESSSLEAVTKDANRVWYIIFQKALAETEEAGLKEHSDLTWLNSNFRFVSEETWGPITIYVYTR